MKKKQLLNADEIQDLNIQIYEWKSKFYCIK